MVVTSLIIISLIVFSLLIVVTIIIKRDQVLFIKTRLYLFLLITIFIIVISVFLIGYTIHKNITSDTKGPVHWHADFEIYDCDNRVELTDPKTFLTNRIGSPLFHEHNDNRIHVEGTVDKIEDISLSSFFEVVGGKLTEEELLIPTNKGSLNTDSLSRRNGELCMGNYRIYCVPKELLTEDDIPKTWGLLEVYPSGYIRLRKNVYKGWRGVNWWHTLSADALLSERRMLYNHFFAREGGEEFA